MKRTTIVLGALITIVLVIASGMFTSVESGLKGGGVIPPRIPQCNQTLTYDIRMDVFMDVGYVTNTKAAVDADVSVPVLMYAMDTIAGIDTSLIVLKFDNTIYYNSTELEFIDITSADGGWTGTFNFSEASDVGDMMAISVAGSNASLKMPTMGWLTMYKINFKILCTDQDEVSLGLHVNETICRENNIAFDSENGVSDDEEFDSWGNSNPDSGPDGYAWILEYKIETWIEDEEVLLGSSSNVVTVYANEVNYKYDEIEHFLKFDDDMYNCSDLTLEIGSDHFVDSEFEVDGDSIYIRLWNEVPDGPMDEITVSTPLYSLEFTLVNPSGPGTQDDVISPVYFIEDASNCVMPFECHDLCGTITEHYAAGALTIPPYTVDLYLEFDDDYREPGESAFLDVWIRTNFVAGLRQGGGDIRLMIVHDHRLSFTKLDGSHDELSFDTNPINGKDTVSVTLLPGGGLGYIEPSEDSIFLCRLQFEITDTVDYECPDAVGAIIWDEYQYNDCRTEITDTTGSVVCRMTPGNDRITAYDDDFSPWCIKLYTVNVAGSNNVWQQLYLYHDMVVDSVNFNLNWDDNKFCLLNDTYWAPGLYTANIPTPNGLYVRGSQLNLPAGENTLLADLHFGVDATGQVDGATGFWQPFAYFTHIVDDYGTPWYPLVQGGTISGYLDLGQVPLCPDDEPRKIDGTIKPENFALHQNYPNPFNPTTEIAFDIGKFTWVRVEIYNVLGQKIATLVDSPMDAGSYEVEWNTDSDTPSGVYFYTIQADAYSETKKMMLLK